MKRKLRSKNDLSHIDNVEDLYQQMELTRARIKLAEYGLKESLKKIPKTLIKTDANAILPQLLKKWKWANRMFRLFGI